MSDPRYPSENEPVEEYSPFVDDYSEAASAKAEDDKSLELTAEQLAAAAKEQMRAFEQLTLAQVLAQFLRNPRQTMKLLHDVSATSSAGSLSDEAVAASAPPQQRRRITTTATRREVEKEQQIDDRHPRLSAAEWRREWWLIGIRSGLLLVAWFGNGLVVAAGRTGGSPTFGVVLLVLAVMGWVAAEVVFNWGGLRSWWDERGKPTPPPTPEKPESFIDARYSLLDGVHPVRVVLFVFGVFAIAVTVIFTRNNTFTPIGFLAWMVAIVSFAGALASDEFLFTEQRLIGRIPRFWKSGTFYALVVIILVGAFFRLVNLENTPQQMTSDHVEKLLDAQRVLDGTPQVFFPNNGGREPFQMYAMAILASLPGLSMDFTTLKLLSAIEGIITLPFLWWMGREVIGRDNRQLGNVVGLILAALVAVSGWHTALSRLALRIILTPLIGSWLLIYLWRAMRFNRRDDYLKAGIALGAGLYMYQAVRMFPVVITVGVLIAMLAHVRSWRTFRQYTFNYIALVFMSAMVFVPLLSFSIQYPELFWRRTAGRLLGDSVVQDISDDGTIILREPTITEQLQAFNDNLPILGDNIRDVLLMFNYRGDVAWINNALNVPHMDNLVGGLFIIGLGAWLVRMIRRRDAADILIPIALFILLMPSALAIAYPVENPSATRTSGALPLAYLIAAYPLALVVQSLTRVINARRIAWGVGAAVVGMVMLISYNQNATTYFQRFHENYLQSSLPYKQGGADLRAFNRETNTEGGNAFMIAYPFWWDHRALGFEGGMVDYPNGIISREGVPQFLHESYTRSGNYRFNPNKDLLFFFALDDIDTLEQLQLWFPAGEARFVTIEAMNRSYATYRVPALGFDVFMDFLQEYGDVVSTSE